MSIKKRARRSFSDEYRAKAVELVRSSGKSIAAVAQDLGVVPSVLSNWVRRSETEVVPEPNVLDRNFVVDAPNRAWATDITYAPTWEGWLYLAVVIDLYARRVVGWSMQDHMRTDLVSEALFRTLKYVPSYPRKAFDPVDAAWAWVERFVDWYNHEHRHSGIGFVTPNARHREFDIVVLEARREVYAAARAKNPRRWSKTTRAWGAPALVALDPRDPRTSARAASERRVGVTSGKSIAAWSSGDNYLDAHRACRGVSRARRGRGSLGWCPPCPVNGDQAVKDGCKRAPRFMYR